MNENLKTLLDFPNTEETDKVYLSRTTGQYVTRSNDDTSLKGNKEYKYIGVVKNIRSFQSQKKKPDTKPAVSLLVYLLTFEAVALSLMWLVLVLESVRNAYVTTHPLLAITLLAVAVIDLYLANKAYEGARELVGTTSFIDFIKKVFRNGKYN